MGIYLAIFSRLGELLLLDPWGVLPYLFGGFLAFGVLGMFVGAFTGLATKLLLEKLSASPETWWPAIAVSGTCTAAVAFLTLYVLAQALHGLGGV